MSGKELQPILNQGEAVWTVVFSPDGGLVLTGGVDRTARLWNMETGQVVRQFVGHVSPVQSAAFSSDGQFVLTGDLLSAYLWLTELEEVIEFACGQLTRDFTAEERILYSIDEALEICS
jgi:WD40 repeat protein